MELGLVNASVFFTIIAAAATVQVEIAATCVQIAAEMKLNSNFAEWNIGGI